jgi:hypothetical protein
VEELRWLRQHCDMNEFEMNPDHRPPAGRPSRKESQQWICYPREEVKSIESACGVPGVLARVD